MTDGRRSAALPWVIALGALLRIAAALVPPSLSIDEARYLVTAHHLRHGFGYADWNGPEVDIPPLHPLLTAALGKDAQTLVERGRMVSLVAALLGLPVVALLAMRLADRTTAVVAVLLMAVHPWLVRDASRVQAETLSILFVAGALLLLRLERHPFAGAAGAGGAFAVAYLARPEAVLVGVLAAGALVVLERPSRRALARAAMLFGALVIASMPYLAWLRHHVGAWTLTGKASEVFFIGQALHENGGEAPTAEAVARLQEEGRDGLLAYCLAHPGAVLRRVAHLLALLVLWILPRGLGALGILGCCALILLRPDGASRAWWAALPALVLPLAAFACPEEHVVAAMLPFLFVPAAAGLVAWARSVPRGRAGAAWFAAAALLLAGWVPAAARVADRGAQVFEQPRKEIARAAVEMEPDLARIATNSAVIALHLAAPDLLGTPGRFRPLPYDLDCAGLRRELEGRQASVAALDRPQELDVPPTESCGLGRIARRDDPRARRVITLDALPRAPR